MELFFSRISGNSARAAFALFEAGVPWRQHVVDPRVRDNRQPAYLKLNPMGKVPALVDDAFVLWESNAINWYVAEKHPEARLLPTSLQARAAIQRWLYFQVGHVSPACLPIMRATNNRVQEFWKVQVGDRAAADAGRKELERFLPVIETALAGRDWLEGDFSLADLAFVPHFALIAEGGFDFAPYPAVRGWLNRMRARPAWRQTAALIFD